MSLGCVCYLCEVCDASGSSSRLARAPCWHGLGLLPTALDGDTGWGDGHSEALTALRKARHQWAHKVPFVPAWATLPTSAWATRRAMGDRRKAEPSRLSLSHRR